MNSPGIDGWDPAVTFDAKGLVHVVWCGFQDGDYDVYWRRAEAEPRRLSAHGEYDLHPWIAASPDGTVWVSWDVVVIPHHANSGRTTIYVLRLFGVRTIVVGIELLVPDEKLRASALRYAIPIHASDTVSAALAGMRGQLPSRASIMLTAISGVNTVLAILAQPRED